MNNNLKEKLKALPLSSGVYLMKDNNNNVIYVGKAKNLKRRVNQYFDTREKNLKTELLVQNIQNFDYILTNSEYDALMLENNLIKKYQPRFNILLKDGKNFAYIKIDLNKKFPKLELSRKVEFKKNVKYFGPYFNGISAHSVMDIVKYAYPLRSCNLGFSKPEKRECLKFGLGECSAPCTNRISEEEYNKIVLDVIDFLNGETKKVKQILTQKMTKCAELENFESAIIFKEQLEMLAKLNNKFTTQFAKNVNIDVVGHYELNNNVGVSIMIVRNGKMLGVENFVLIDKFFDDNSLANFIVQYYQNNKILPKSIVVAENFLGKDVLEEFFAKNFDKKVEIETVQKGTKKVLFNKACENAKEYL
ncbi:MAG: excinuclease ABC subunit UvrC, partial [Christensenellales bacterium]